VSTAHELCLISGYRQQFLCSNINYVWRLGIMSHLRETKQRLKLQAGITTLNTTFFVCHPLFALIHRTEQTARLFYLYMRSPSNKQTCFLASMSINFKSKSTNYQIKVLFSFSALLCRIYSGLVTLIAPDYWGTKAFFHALDLN
jgi:hypothetical protein